MVSGKGPEAGVALYAVNRYWFAASLPSDVVGYSRLMDEDEVGTARELGNPHGLWTMDIAPANVAFLPPFRSCRLATIVRRKKPRWESSGRSFVLARVSSFVLSKFLVSGRRMKYTMHSRQQHLTALFDGRGNTSENICFATRFPEKSIAQPLFAFAFML